MEIISGILPSTLPLFRERAETLKADRQKFLAHLKQVNENLIGNRAKEQAASATDAAAAEASTTPGPGVGAANKRTPRKTPRLKLSALGK